MTADDLFGRIVISRAGRDSGRRFAIVGVEAEEFLLLCDGGLRRLSRPKKKKLKHVCFTKDTVTGLEEAMERDRLACDAFIRKAIAALDQSEE